MSSAPEAPLGCFLWAAPPPCPGVAGTSPTHGLAATAGTEELEVAFLAAGGQVRAGGPALPTAVGGAEALCACARLGEAAAARLPPLPPPGTWAVPVPGPRSASGGGTSGVVIRWPSCSLRGQEDE